MILAVAGCAGAVTVNLNRAWSPTAARWNGLCGRLDLPAGRRLQLQRAGRAGAEGGDLDLHRPRFARGEQLDLGTQAERQPAESRPAGAGLAPSV